MGQAERDRFLKYQQTYRSSAAVNNAIKPEPVLERGAPSSDEDEGVRARNNKANSTRENRFGKDKHSKSAMKTKNNQKVKKDNNNA